MFFTFVFVLLSNMAGSVSEEGSVHASNSIDSVSRDISSRN